MLGPWRHEVDKTITAGGDHARARVARGCVVDTRHITPEDFGIPRAPTHALRGGDPAMNADILRRILHGEASYYRNLVLVNAAAALSAAGKAASFLDGVETAAQAIDSGAARVTLATLIEFTRNHRR